MFTISRQKRRELGDKELGQEYDQTEQVMEIMNNYATRTSVLPFLTYIPAKKPWTVLWASVLVHEVHPYAKTDLRTEELGHWENL